MGHVASQPFPHHHPSGPIFPPVRAGPAALPGGHRTLTKRPLVGDMVGGQHPAPPHQSSPPQAHPPPAGGSHLPTPHLTPASERGGATISTRKGNTCVTIFTFIQLSSSHAGPLQPVGQARHHPGLTRALEDRSSSRALARPPPSAVAMGSPPLL